ncbi:LamG-like jellyroll fold domain-containing protein [Haloferula sp. A504]|uniref:LamG-like jellyroll fold domain-containing protein n=1 Tax=Haloferula sp. A504 TaxID=3373601 RepID=UPI0031C88000|nr:LamG domain-containing protein [Verrucomicrobiaceae bacterium E54]
MNDRNDKVIDKTSLWKDLAELEEGTLDPARSEALSRLLDDSPVARQLYLEYFEDSAVLREIARTLDERGRMPVVGDALASRRALRRSVMSAAAVVVLLGVISAVIKITVPEVPVVSSAAVEGTKWSIDGKPRESDEEELSLRPGTTVRVESGAVRLKQDSGSALVIQGPAEVSFPELGRPELRSGWLWIDATGDDEGFVVSTRDFVVRDIGTRFGVRVPRRGPMEVHLIEGRVQVEPKAGSSMVSDLSVAGTAEAFANGGRRSAVPLAADPFPGLSELLAGGSGYRTTLLGQSPAGYWTLDEPSGMELGNEVADGSIGFHGVAVEGGVAGVGARGALAGFPAGNRALYLDGSPDQSVVAGIDGPGGVRRREGAVSFWIRRVPGAERRDEILWLAGDTSRDVNVPDRAMIHTRLSRTGHLEFVVDDDGTSTQVASSRDIADGQWHHVVASWGPSAVDLYVDGHRTASAARAGTVEEGSFSGRYVRFGKPSRNLYDDYHSFTGWVDEIAMWNRPLTADEVAVQYQAAKGMADQP